MKPPKSAASQASELTAHFKACVPSLRIDTHQRAEGAPFAVPANLQLSAYFEPPPKTDPGQLGISDGVSRPPKTDPGQIGISGWT